MDSRAKAPLHPGACRCNIFSPGLHCLRLQLCCLRRKHNDQQQPAIAKKGFLVLELAARRLSVHTLGTAHLWPKANGAVPTQTQRHPCEDLRNRHDKIAQRLSSAEILAIAMAKGNAWAGRRGRLSLLSCYGLRHSQLNKTRLFDS